MFAVTTIREDHLPDEKGAIVGVQIAFAGNGIVIDVDEDGLTSLLTPNGEDYEIALTKDGGLILNGHNIKDLIAKSWD